MRISGYVRCVTCVLVLSVWHSSAQAVAVSQPITMSGQALQATTLIVTLPSGAQQTVRADDKKGAFRVTPDSKNPDGGIGHVDIGGGDGGDGGDGGLVTVTDRASGHVIMSGVLNHGTLTKPGTAPESSTTDTDSAVDDSDKQIRYFTRDITIKEGDDKQDARVVLVPLTGGSQAQEQETDRVDPDKRGTVHFGKLLPGLYRIDVYRTDPYWNFPIPPTTRYLWLTSDMRNPVIDIGAPQFPLVQAFAWWTYFKHEDSDKGVKVMEQQLGMYGMSYINQLAPTYMTGASQEPFATPTPMPTMTPSTSWNSQASGTMMGTIPSMDVNPADPIKAAIFSPGEQGFIHVWNLDATQRLELGSTLKWKLDCIGSEGLLELDRQGLPWYIGQQSATTRFYTTKSPESSLASREEFVREATAHGMAREKARALYAGLQTHFFKISQNPQTWGVIVHAVLRDLKSIEPDDPATVYDVCANFDLLVKVATERAQQSHGYDPAPRSESLPRDPFFYSTGHAKSRVKDQWGLQEIGFEATGRDRKGSLWPEKGAPVLVAVVDTGLDLGHPDLKGVLWTNDKEIPDNGKDDDGNGLVDDVSGWNFVEFNNDVRDNNGHGTFVSGIIAANTDNVVGIAGVNPWARILPVKVSDFANDSDTISIAMGISYAARMGARVINVSIGGKVISRAEQAAIEFANSKGALVVVAAGNDGANVKDYSPAGLDGVIVATAINSKGRRENYSNWGKVDIAAPGSDIVSLRAAHTDLMQFELKDYAQGANIVGQERLLYYASGTSFSAPYVTGVASLLLSIHPELTAAEVKRVILQSAKDIDVPGLDQFTGYGLLDAAAALKADPAFFIEAEIDGVGLVNKEGPQVRVSGTADADRLKGAWIEIGKGENPGEWKKVAEVRKSVKGGALGDIPAAEFGGAKEWVIRLVVKHKNGRKRENRFILKLG